MTASIKSDEFIGERIGKVSRINKILNPTSQNMRIFIETSDQGLYYGMYVFGEIIVGEIDNTFLIKRNLIEDNNVFVITDNKLRSKKIEVIQIFEENAIIRGLSNNDRVLNEPIKGAFNGMAVDLINNMRDFIKYFVKYPVSANVLMILIIIFGFMGLF